jgi:SagB-type dehydrogenase family enzyme
MCTMKPNRIFLTAVAALCLCGTCIGAEPELPAPVKLEQPDLTRGRPLMQALKERQSRRKMDKRPLSHKDLSDLLWAAFGVNRPDTGKRTAPSAVNWQEIDVYVALPEGLFIYDASAHQLQPVSGKDFRPLTSRQPFVTRAPVILIYVADLARMTRGDAETKAFYSTVDTGFISQNVYLFCASENLATVVLGSVNKVGLGRAMGLRPEQRVILTQPVGYPSK